MKTKRISFDIDEDTLDILKARAREDHRSLASYLRNVLYSIAYVDSEIPKEILTAKKEPPVKQKEKGFDEVTFSTNKPKLKGGFR